VAAGPGHQLTDRPLGEVASPQVANGPKESRRPPGPAKVASEVGVTDGTRRLGTTPPSLRHPCVNGHRCVVLAPVCEAAGPPLRLTMPSGKLRHGKLPEQAQRRDQAYAALAADVGRIMPSTSADPLSRVAVFVVLPPSLMTVGPRAVAGSYEA
jgi:hypothetical protein